MKEFWISIWTHKVCLVVSGNNYYIFYCNLQATSENTLKNSRIISVNIFIFIKWHGGGGGGRYRDKFF